MTVNRSYDTVILGAGLGGLVLGTLLSRRGRKVLILEEQPAPGGASQIVHYEGYPFAQGPGLLLGLEKEGYTEQLFSQLGISLAMLKRTGGLLKRPAPFLQVVTDRYRINLETNRADQLSEYKREWGEVLTGFQQFYKDLDAIEELLYPYFFKKNLPGPPLPLREKIDQIQQGIKRRWIIHRNLKINSLEYITRYHLPPEFFQILDLTCQLWFGRNLSTTPLLHLLLQQILAHKEVVRPAGGLVKLCEILVKGFVEYRGEIRYRQEIASIAKKSRQEWIIESSGETLRTRHLVVHYPWDHWIPQPYEFMTYYFAIEEQVIPVSMCDQVLVQPGSTDPKTLFLVLSTAEDEKSYIDKKRLLSASVLYSRHSSPKEPAIRQWLQEVIKTLNWLMPFSEGKIRHLGNNHRERQVRSERFKKIQPFLKHLRHKKQLHAAYGYQPFERSLYVLPDHGNRLAVSLAEVKIADEISNSL